jgi:outer membrane receptor protein involved in Fe transport
MFIRVTAVLIITFFSFYIALYGQPIPNRPKIGKISGSVIDAQSGEKLPYATAVILNYTDSALVSGGITDENGFFQIDSVPLGLYRLKISFIGYPSWVSDSFRISFRNPEKNFDAIKLTNNNKKTETVVIEAEKLLFQAAIDRKIYNVDKNIVNIGGSATDVLQNIPAVSVDIDGSVSMRGSSSVTIFIDGKPSGLTGPNRQAALQSIPAGMIERVELITNPSAKFDAEGMAGIINIILKKIPTRGTNGNLLATAGTRNKYNLAGTYNRRFGKLAINSNYNFRYNQHYSFGNGSRKNFFPDTTYYLNQEMASETYLTTHNARLGIEYLFDTNTQLTIGSSVNRRFERKPTNNHYRLKDNFEQPYRNYHRYGYNTETGNNYEINWNFKRKLSKKRRQEVVVLDGSYSLNDKISPTHILEEDDDLPPLFPPYRQHNIEKATFSILSSQLDYTLPLKTGKFETGVKLTHRKINNSFFSESYRDSLAAYAPDVDLNNEFIYKEAIPAAYAQYGFTKGNWGFQTGVRTELTDARSVLVTTTESYNRQYRGFFPSVFINRRLNNGQEFKINYSRRINRPTIEQLKPFVDRTDPANLRRGNPNVNAEFIDSYELSYLKFWGAHSLNLSTYYRNTNNAIVRYRTAFPDGTSYITFLNLSRSTSYGIECISTHQFWRIWNITANLNFFQTVISGNAGDGDLNVAQITWTGKLISNLKINKTTDIQLTANYNAPRAIAQGTFYGMSALDLGFKKDLAGGKYILTVNATDVFDTRQMEIKQWSTNFEQRNFRKRETRVLTIGLNYKFGKPAEENTGASSGKKRRRENTDTESSGEMDGF